MKKFNDYFKNSYGYDNLSKYLTILGFIFLLNKNTWIAGIVLIGYGFWRSISKNKYKRSNELMAFENVLSIVKQWFIRTKYKFNDFLHYKIFKCPNCSQKLRVPRKKGNITITCKKCGTSFKGKS